MYTSLNKLFVIIETKVEIARFEELKAFVKKMPQMYDLKELYEKVVPPLSEFEKSMAQYSNAHKKFEQIIIRTDQVLLDKASKVSITELRQEMKVNYSLISKVDDVDYELTERMLKIEDQQDQIVNNLQKMEDRLQLELKAAVRRMAIKAHNAGGGGNLLSRAKAQQQEQ